MFKNNSILLKLTIILALIFISSGVFAENDIKLEKLVIPDEIEAKIMDEYNKEETLEAENVDITEVKDENIEKTENENPEKIIVENNTEKPEEIVEKEPPASITVIKNNERVTETKYTITAGDVLSFSVYAEPNLTQPEIKVRPDGCATIEPIGEIFVADKSIQEVTSEIFEKMSIYFRDPQISLNVKRFNPASIYVYGAVKKPGSYQQNIETPTVWHNAETVNAKTDLSLTNVLSIAGGIEYNADLSHILVSNNLSGYTKEVDLWKLINEGDTSQNIKLKSGDSVYVPKLEGQIYNDEDFEKLSLSSISSDDFIVRVIGEVNTPGLYRIPSESPTLNSAISMARGYTISGKRFAVQILRKTNEGNLSKINVDPHKTDVMLRPDDIVYVRDRKLMKIVRAGQYISQIFAGVTAPASSYNQWAEVFDPNRRWLRE